MDDLGLVVLLAAVVSSGTLTGAFLLYAHTVMPALRRAGDSEFVATFDRLDRAILNPVFLLTGFLGAPVLTLAAALLVDDARGWILAALGLHVVMVVITGGVNVPRNDGLKAAVARAAAPSGIRADFDEGRWVRWNLVRVVLTVAATALLGVALVELGGHR